MGLHKFTRTMTIIHAKNVLLENIYINSTDSEHAVGFDFSSLNVRTPTFATYLHYFDT